MHEIAKDIGGVWKFDGEKTYWCVNNKNKVVGKIYGEYLPDPYKLWQQKCYDKQIALQSHQAKVLRPSGVVFKLWEHWTCQT